MNWYYSDAGQACGPVTEQQLVHLVRSAELSPETLVWQSELPEWKPFIVLLPGALRPEPQQEIPLPQSPAVLGNPFQSRPESSAETTLERRSLFSRLFGKGKKK